jgi:hypothetical protein
MERRPNKGIELFSTIKDASLVVRVGYMQTLSQMVVIQCG